MNYGTIEVAVAPLDVGIHVGLVRAAVSAQHALERLDSEMATQVDDHGGLVAPGELAVLYGAVPLELAFALHVLLQAAVQQHVSVIAHLKINNTLEKYNAMVITHGFMLWCFRFLSLSFPRFMFNLNLVTVSHIFKIL